MDKMRNGLTLVELNMVIAIIVVIALISIPSILLARRNANENAAIHNVKAFSTAAANFMGGNEQRHWESDISGIVGNASNFGDFYSFAPERGGYNFRYLSNDLDGNSSHTASNFVFVGFPTTLNQGTLAFYCDEANRLWEMPDLDDAMIGEFFNLINGDVNFSAPIIVGRIERGVVLATNWSIK